MHLAVVKLKDGQVLDGHLWTVRPREGWFELVDDEIRHRIPFDDCESVVVRGERVGISLVDDVEQLPRWKKMAEEEKSRSSSS